MSTQYFLQSTDVDASCPPGGAIAARDLARPPGSGTVITSLVTSAVPALLAVFDRDVSGDGPAAGDHDVSVRIRFIDTGGGGNNPRVQFRLISLDAGCATVDDSPYSALDIVASTYSNRTATLTLSWSGSAERLRLEVWGRKLLDVDVSRQFQIDVGSSWDVAPWTVPGGPVPLRRTIRAEQRPECFAGRIVRPMPAQRSLLRPGDGQKRIARRPRISDAGLRAELSPPGSSRRPPLLRTGGVQQDAAPRPRIVRPGQPAGYDSPDLITGRAARPPLLRPNGPAPVAGGLPPRRVLLDRNTEWLAALFGRGVVISTQRIGGPRPPTGSPTERFRLNSPTLAFTDRPFEGEGLSLYATAGQRVQYRNLRVLGTCSKQRSRTGWIKAGTNHNLAAASVLKTARRGFLEAAAGATVSPTLDLTQFPELAGGAVAFDVRHFREDVENETDNAGIVRADVDGAFLEVLEIRGVAQLIATEVRAGGVVRFRWRWIPADDTTPPEQFRWLRTAGPTLPPDFVVASFGAGLYELDSTPLADSAPYTFMLRAEVGIVSLDLLSGVTVQADASGPPAAQQLVTSVR